MNGTTIFTVCGILLFAIGLYGALAARPLLRRILAANIMGNGVFMVLVAGAYLPADGGAATGDPVAHALVLTGIVVAVSATALGLQLVCRLHELASGDREPDP